MVTLLQSVADRVVFKAYLASDGVTQATGKTIAVVLSKAGAAFGNPSAGATNATEIAQGWYYIDLSTTDKNTLGPLIVRGTEGTIDHVETVFYVVQATNGGMTALPNAAAEAAGGLYTRGTGAGQVNQSANGRADANTISVSGTTQTARDLGASVLLSAGTGTGQLDFTSGVVKASLAQILGTAITGTAAQLAAAFTKFFDKASPTGTINSLPDAVAGATGGLFIAGTNAATTVTTALTTTFTGNLTGSVASVTGNVGGNVTGTVGTVNALAANSITAAALAADAAVELRSLASGTSDSGSTTTLVDAARTEADTDYWVGQLLVFTSGTIAGQARMITGFVPGTDTMTFAPATTQAVSTQTYEIWPMVDFLRATVAGRTLDVSATGEAGIDWANIGSPTTAQNLSGTNIDVDQVVASVSGAVGSVSGAVASVTGNVGGNVTGSVGSVVGAVTVGTNTDKTGYGLSGAAVTAIWDALTSALTTAGSVGKLLVDNVNATISSRLASASYTAPLDAAGVRTAVGLATANLDTQLGAIDDFLDTEIGAIKTKTDSLTFTTANKVDATLQAAGDFAQGAADKVWSTTTRALTDKVGFALSAGGIQALWDALTAALTTAGSVGKLLVDNVNATISSRLPTASYVAPLDAAGVRGAVGLATANLDTQLSSLQADTDNLQARLPAALVGGRLDASVGSMAADVLTASALAADAVTEIQAGLSTLTAAGIRTAVGLASANLDTQLVAIDDAVDTEVAAVLAAVDTEIAAIKAKTDALPASPAAVGSAMTLTPGERTSVAGVVWEEALSGHTTGGSAGDALAAAGSAGDPWSTPLPGAYGAGTAGQVVGTTLDATVSSRASQASVTTIDDFLDTEVLAIKAKTDSLTFTTANKVDSTIQAADDLAQGAADKVWGTTTRALTDKAGFALSAGGIQAIWDALTSALTAVGSVGKLLVDNINVTISSRLASASYTAPLDAPGVRTAVGLASANLDTQLSSVQADTDNLQTRLPAALVGGRIDASVGSMAADVVTASALATDAVTELQGGVSTLDAADVRSAVGLATANLDTQLAALSGFLDTEVAAILAAVDTEVAAIKAKTDLLPATPAATGDAMTLTSDERTTLAAALLDLANAIETGLTLRQALRLVVAAEAGKVSGMATNTVTIRNAVADSTDRIVATCDAEGNRTALTYDVS